MKHFSVALLCVTGGALMFSVPYFIRTNTKSMYARDGILSGSQRQRGMYLNAGSKDAGIDPDWDPIELRWKGYDRRNNRNNNNKNINNDNNNQNENEK